MTLALAFFDEGSLKGRMMDAETGKVYELFIINGKYKLTVSKFKRIGALRTLLDQEAKQEWEYILERYAQY